MLYRFENVEVDGSAYKATKAGCALSLQPKMLEVLCHLIEHRVRVVTRGELLERFWPNEQVGDAVVTWTVSHIRKQVSQTDGSNRPIETVHGRGYRFTADVTEEDTNDAPSAGAVNDAQAAPPAPVGAMPFVGRVAVMRKLSGALSSTIEGRGQLCVLRGEAGVGKTRCARELMTIAAERGAITLTGGAVEGGGAPVFWPWLQVLRGLAAKLPQLEQRARALLGELSAIDSTVRPNGATGPDTAAPDRRFWLYDQLATLLLDLAAQQPVVVLIDDIHWADRGTLDALQFVASVSDRSSLLLLATEREPIGYGGGRLRTSRLFQHVELGRFSPDDIAAYLTKIAGCVFAPVVSLATAVHAATAGNPLFVEETVRNLLARYGSDHLPKVDPREVRTPTIARDILLVRLALLPDETRNVLSQASVLGEEFELTLLEAVANKPMERLIQVLQPATDSRFVVAQSAHRYKFSHALHREVLYDAMPSSTRVATHRRAAIAIESRRAVESRYAELAHHHYRSLPAGDFAAVVRATCDAATAAKAVCSHADAVKFYLWALEAQALDSQLAPRARAELLLSTGQSQRHAGSDRDARDTLMRMFELARQHDFADLLVEGAAALRPTFMLGTVPDPVARKCLEDALTRAPEGPDPVRIGALALLAGLPPYSTHMSRAKQMSGEALALARAGGERKTLLQALRASFYAMSGPDDTDELLAVVDEVLDDPGDVPHRALVDAFAARAGALYSRGEIALGDVALNSIAALAKEKRLEEVSWYALRQCAQRHLREGNFALAETTADALQERSDRMGLSYGSVFVQINRHALALERQGVEVTKHPEAYAGLGASNSLMPIGYRARLTRGAAEAGLFDVASAELSNLAADGFVNVPKEMGYLNNLSHLALASAALPNAPYAATLYDLLLPYPHRNTPDLLLRYEGSVSRYLALLAIAMQRHAHVERHFEDAMAVNERLAHVPILARTGVEYAQWLNMNGGSQRRTRELAQGAISLAERAGMDWLVKQAGELL